MGSFWSVFNRSGEALQVIEQVRRNDPDCTAVKITAEHYLRKVDFVRLCLGLRNNTHVKYLSLSGLGLKDDEAFLLMDTLGHNNNIEFLNVSQNNFSELAILRILQAIADRKVLKMLWMTGLQNCNFNAEVMDQIYNILNRNKSLFISMDSPIRTRKRLESPATA